MDPIDILSSLLAAILVFMGLIMVKDEIVSKHIDKAIEIINAQPNYLEFAAKHLPEGCYQKNLFHPLKWTFESMFPGLSEYKKD